MSTMKPLTDSEASSAWTDLSHTARRWVLQARQFEHADFDRRTREVLDRHGLVSHGSANATGGVITTRGLSLQSWAIREGK